MTLFLIKQVTTSKKVWQEPFSSKKDGETEEHFSKKTSDTLTCGSCASSSFLPHFDIICDLLLNRGTDM